MFLSERYAYRTISQRVRRRSWCYNILTMVLYSKEGCAPCKMLKKYLSHKGIKYIEKDIADPQNMNEVIKISGQMSVPVLVGNNKVITGYNPRELATL